MSFELLKTKESFLTIKLTFIIPIALAIDTKVGNFAPGKDFDALLVDIAADPIDFDGITNPSADKAPEVRLLELLQKFIYVGDDRNIKEVFVQGERVVG